EIYGAFEGRGISYGASFQGIEELWRGRNEALGRVRLPTRAEGPGAGEYGIHPALLDAALQVLGTALEGGGAFLPLEVERFRCGRARGEVWAHARAREAEGREVRAGEVRLYDASGAPLGLVAMRLKRAEASSLAASRSARAGLYAIG